jgi:hypothetical protein
MWNVVVDVGKSTTKARTNERKAIMRENERLSLTVVCCPMNPAEIILLVPTYLRYLVKHIIPSLPAPRIRLLSPSKTFR